MTGAKKGLILLASRIGGENPLTHAQFAALWEISRQTRMEDSERELTPEALLAAGCKPELARRVVSLLADTDRADRYLEEAEKRCCRPLTWLDPGYPEILLQKLEDRAPACLWYMGDLSILSAPMVALVGSRDLSIPNGLFAQEVGKQAARHGFALVSGNARGADQIGQNACLANGGKVVSIVADSLCAQAPNPNILYLSEGGWGEIFSAARALSRNRYIHCLASRTFVAQCRSGKGGTWDGTIQNLRAGWSRVYCFDDGSPGCEKLVQNGAASISARELNRILEK